ADRQLLESDELSRLGYSAFDLRLVLELRALGRDQAEDDLLAFGNKAKRGKAAGALVIEFEQKTIDRQPGKAGFRDAVVGAVGNPGAAGIATTDMDTDRRVRAALRNTFVDEADVTFEPAVGVVAVVDHFLAQGRAEEIAQQRVVDLDISATGALQR